MPLRPEVRHLYGHAWRTYRLKLLELARYTCAVCQQQFPGHQLSCAHIHHDPREMSLVSVMCIPCHARHDTPQRLAMTRRTRAKFTGQLWLSKEIEFAPVPAWEIPTRIMRGMQEGFYYADREAHERQARPQPMRPAPIPPARRRADPPPASAEETVIFLPLLGCLSSEFRLIDT